MLGRMPVFGPPGLAPAREKFIRNAGSSSRAPSTACHLVSIEQICLNDSIFPNLYIPPTIFGNLLQDPVYFSLTIST